MGVRPGTMEDMVGSIFRGRRVFVTGHTGFKGGWLALTLVHLGAVVRGYALDPPGDPLSDPSLFASARVASLIDDVRGDIRNSASLDQAIHAFAPEVVFHLAAQAVVRQSYADPVNTYATNVLGTANLLESVRSLPSVCAVVVVTSDKCYSNQDWRWGIGRLTHSADMTLTAAAKPASSCSRHPTAPLFSPGTGRATRLWGSPRHAPAM